MLLFDLLLCIFAYLAGVLVCCVVLNTKGELVHFYINAQVLNKRDKINREVNDISPSLRRLGVGNFVDRLMSRAAFTQKVASEVVAGIWDAS